MGLYQISIYDWNQKCINQDYQEFDDLHQAQLKAKHDCDWLGGDHWEVVKIR